MHEEQQSAARMLEFFCDLPSREEKENNSIRDK